jgi:NTE family protein
VPVADLRAVPLLAHLDGDALEQLGERCATRTYAKGDVVWLAGDPADELLIIQSGELEVRGADGAGGELVIGRLGPGEPVGELALLLGETRSATVACSVPAEVVVLDRKAFDEVIRDHRALSLMSEVVSRRAIGMASRRPVARRVQVVGVVTDRDADGGSLVARTIAALAKPLVGRDAIAVARDASDVAALVTEQRAANAHLDLCVLDLGHVDLATATATCDTVVRVTRDGRSSGDSELLTVVNRGTPQPLRSCNPFMLPDEPALHGLAGDDAVAVLVADATLPIRRSLDRLVRKLFGVTVGVALGGGAAFGIAHIGVLRVLERNGIPVDLLAGTSFGSIVAIGAASGLSGDELTALAAKLGNVRTALSVLDPAVDGTGLLAGRRLVRIFAPLISVDRFEQLQRPCAVIATDIESGERVEIADGRLDDAFRASCSIPLVFSPVTSGGRTMVDGAMVDPVPAEVVRGMGADIVIAINVVPRLEKGTSTVISRAFKRISRLNPLSYRRGSRGLPDVVDVLMNSLQVVQYELGRFTSLAADVQVEVDLGGFTWIDFHRAAEIVERGADAGERAVPLVRAAIDERLA